jgi:hypothetical protein
VLVEVVVATYLRVLQLVKNFLGILADWSHYIAHELIFVTQDFLEDLFHVSLNCEKISLDASPIKYWEAATVSE